MAASRRRAAQAAPEPTPEENDTAGSGRTAGEMHELFAEFVTEETGTAVTAEQVFAITSKRVAFRKSEAYEAYRERLDGERDQAAEAKAERAKVRSAGPSVPAEEEAPKRRGRPAKPALKAVKDESESVPAARPRRGRRAAGSAAAPEDAPF